MLSFSANVPKDDLDDAPLEMLQLLNANELFRRGRNLMFRKDHSDQKKGFELLKMAADKGCTQAMSFLSTTTSFREDIRCSLEDSVKYIKKGCELEDPDCLSIYADMLINGNGVPQNKKEALKYLKKGIELGDERRTHLYEELQLDIDRPKSYPPEVAQIKESADQGDVESMFKIGIILIQGQNQQVERDLNEGQRYLFAAAERGSGEALFMLAYCYESGIGFEVDHKKSIEFYRKGADKGHIKCLHNLGLRLMYGSDDVRNVQDAFKYMKMAADKGCTLSMCELGKMLSSDVDGVGNDPAQAKEYFKKSADGGYVDGMYMYSKCAANGWGFEKPDHNEAKKYMKMAADSGDLKYVKLYADLCDSDMVFKPDKPEALKYYKIMADNGCNDSMFKVGKILLHGDDGIPVNKREAVKYIRMAVQMDHIEAIELYSEMLKTGDGVLQDEEEAKRYANKAETLRNPDITSCCIC